MRARPQLRLSEPLPTRALCSGVVRAGHKTAHETALCNACVTLTSPQLLIYFRLWCYLQHPGQHDWESRQLGGSIMTYLVRYLFFARRREFWSCFALQDQKEGMAAFIEKRKPGFQDR